MSGAVSRRQVLAGLAVGAVSGCGTGTSATKRPPTVRPSAASATPTSRAAGPPDWAALRARLTGRLVQRGQQGYDAAWQLFNARFDAAGPDAVAAAGGEADVVACVRFAREYGLPLRIRSGGHSYLGASAGSGLVVDLRPLATVRVERASATIGAGAALVDVYRSLAAQGVSIPAGSCPSVGISGLALGGGMGVVARQYGLTCDRLSAARVVLADGRVVTASPTSEPDLFWALRGGGGNFGIVTALTFVTHPIRDLATFTLSWPFAAAAAVLGGWQRWTASQPDALWSTCQLLATTESAATAAISGVYVGTSGQLAGPLSALRAAVGAAPRSVYVRDRGYLDTMLLEAGCAAESVAGCHVAGQVPGGRLPRDAFVAGSDFFAAAIPAAAVGALVRAVQDQQDGPALGVGGAAFDSWGGAVNRVAPGATAFVHRDALFGAQYTASWPTGQGGGPQSANQQSLRTIAGTLRSAATGAAYQNYADPSLARPEQAYYGANLPRLQAVKARYDPGGLFTQPQGITPA